MKAWKGLQPGQAISASEHNRLCKAVFESYGTGAARVSLANGRMQVYSSGVDFGAFEFGLASSTRTTMTFNAGTIVVGTDVVAIPETTVTAAGGTEGSPFYAQVEVDHEDLANSRILPVTATLFQSDGFTRIPLLKCYLEYSVIKFPSRGYLCHVGSILLPSFYSTA